MKNGLMANMEKAEFRCILACILKKDGIVSINYYEKFF